MFIKRNMRAVGHNITSKRQHYFKNTKLENLTQAFDPQSRCEEVLSFVSLLQILNNATKISLPSCNTCSFIKNLHCTWGCTVVQWIMPFQRGDCNEIKSIFNCISSDWRSLMFERKCKESNKWACPEVIYAWAFGSLQYNSLLLTTWATDPQRQIVFCLTVQSPKIFSMLSQKMQKTRIEWQSSLKLEAV